MMTPSTTGRIPFPVLDALTRHFSMGAPRTFSVSPDGTNVYFLRTSSVEDHVLHLWRVSLDGEGATEQRVVDVAALVSDEGENIPSAERQRRERMRESSAGITAYSLDATASRAVFALSGALYVVELTSGFEVRRLGTSDDVIDPRLSPSGEYVAYLGGNELCVISVATGQVDRVATAATDTTVGLANYVAAEEFERQRGHWWSPDSTTLLYEIADNRALDEVWLFDPKTPTVAPTSRRYPKAGSPNPDVSLALWARDGLTHQVEWDRERFEYLVTASWDSMEGPLITVMTRDHHDQVVLRVSPTTGATTSLISSRDDDFLEWIPGLPAMTPDGRLLVAFTDRVSDTYRVATVTDGVAVPFSPEGLQVGDVVAVSENAVLVNATTDATTGVSALVKFDGSSEIVGSNQTMTRTLAGSPGSTTVRAVSTLEDTTTAYAVSRPGSGPHSISSFARSPREAYPPVAPSVRLLTVGPHDLAVAVLLPMERTTTTKLPIIMSPYGGPHYQRVVGAALPFALDQWIADQGFCVIVADGRGTGGRGPAWDRSVVGRLGTLPVLDQVAALDAVIAELGEVVDPTRVGIRGWSFGGYLAARCVLERPDRFHAAVAGAPVTDFRWYDTGYTERYLGHPARESSAYLEADLVRMAPQLRRPLLFLHGFIDDNVLFAHTQMLSDALLAAGAAHRVIGLSGATHMASDPVVAQNIVQLQIDFFRETLHEVSS